MSLKQQFSQLLYKIHGHHCRLKAKEPHIIGLKIRELWRDKALGTCKG